MLHGERLLPLHVCPRSVPGTLSHSYFTDTTPLREDASAPSRSPRDDVSGGPGMGRCGVGWRGRRVCGVRARRTPTRTFFEFQPVPRAHEVHYPNTVSFILPTIRVINLAAGHLRLQWGAHGHSLPSSTSPTFTGRNRVFVFRCPLLPVIHFPCPARRYCSITPRSDRGKGRRMGFWGGFTGCRAGFETDRRGPTPRHFPPYGAHSPPHP